MYPYYPLPDRKVSNMLLKRIICWSMNGRHSISDEGVMMRWMQLELGRINLGIVKDRKKLSDLLLEERPVSVTKDGKEYRFDKDTLAAFASGIPEALQRKLRLPVLFYCSADVPDSCMVTDEVVVEVLRVKNEISPLRSFENGKLWLSKPIAYAILRKYPTLFQLVLR
jgi:uncharacterized protein (UPF0216 family)